jgi:hypothetical protein
MTRILVTTLYAVQGDRRTFQVRADQLSEGTHHLTATVVDSAGQETSATVVLTVRRVSAPPVEDPPVEDPPVEDPPVEDPPVEDPPTCAVRYTVHGDWPTGFTSQICNRHRSHRRVDP